VFELDELILGRLRKRRAQVNAGEIVDRTQSTPDMVAFQRARIAHPRPTACSRRRGADRRVSRGAQPLDDRLHERWRRHG